MSVPEIFLKELPEGIRWNKDYNGVKRATYSKDGYRYALYYCPTCDGWVSGVSHSEAIIIKKRKVFLEVCNRCGKTVTGRRANIENGETPWDAKWGIERE